MMVRLSPAETAAPEPEVGTRVPPRPTTRAGLLTQVVGFKYVRLYDASNTPFLYRSSAPWESQRRWPSADTEAGAPTSAAPQGTISLVDVEQPDLERFPLFSKAHFVETVLVRQSMRARDGRPARLLSEHACRPATRARATRSSSRQAAGTSSRA